MSARMQTPHTKQASGRVILHTVGPAVRLQEVCSALAELGFAIIPVSDTTSTDPLWTTSVEDATPVTLTMLPDDALVPATAAIPTCSARTGWARHLLALGARRGSVNANWQPSRGFRSATSQRWKMVSVPSAKRMPKSWARPSKLIIACCYRRRAQCSPKCDV